MFSGVPAAQAKVVELTTFNSNGSTRKLEAADKPLAEHPGENPSSKSKCMRTPWRALSMLGIGAAIIGSISLIPRHRESDGSNLRDPNLSSRTINNISFPNPFSDIPNNEGHAGCDAAYFQFSYCIDNPASPTPTCYGFDLLSYCNDGIIKQVGSNLNQNSTHHLSVENITIFPNTTLVETIFHRISTEFTEITHQNITFSKSFGGTLDENVPCNHDWGKENSGKGHHPLLELDCPPALVQLTDNVPQILTPIDFEDGLDKNEFALIKAQAMDQVMIAKLRDALENDPAITAALDNCRTTYCPEYLNDLESEQKSSQ